MYTNNYTGVQMLEDIIAFYVNLLQTLVSTPKVYAFNVFDADEDNIEALLGVPNAAYAKGWHVHSWHVDRRASPGIHNASETGIQQHEITIYGFYEIDSFANSRITFRQICNTVLEQLRKVTEIPGIEYIGPVQVESDDNPPTMVGPCLCHTIVFSSVAHEHYETAL